MLGMASGLSLERARCLFQARLHEKQRLTLGRVGETRVASTTSKCQAPEKVWSSSPSAPFCLFALSLLCTCRSTLRDVKKKKKKVGNYQDPPPASPPSPPPTSTAHTYRNFGHWTLNSFLVCEFGECKHNQRGRKNKSVIARDSLCQHLSWWTPRGKRGHSLDYLLTKGAV